MTIITAKNDNFDSDRRSNFPCGTLKVEKIHGLPKEKKTSPGADESEHAAPMLSLLQTDLFLVSLFFSERKAVAVP